MSSGNILCSKPADGFEDSLDFLLSGPRLQIINDTNMIKILKKLTNNDR